MPIVADFMVELRRHSPTEFGVWRAVDLHNHSPTSGDFQGNVATAADDTVARLKDTNVDIVMFTDHERLPDARFTDDVARRSGRTVLRGVELNVFVDAYSKPAGKVDKNIFYHLLVGFDPDGPQTPDYWLAHLKKECPNETRDISGSKLHGFTDSVDNICNLLDEAGALIIPAHLHKTRDVFKSRSIDDIYVDPQFLKLARDRFTALEVTDLTTAAFFDGLHEETKHLHKTCIRSSDAHSPALIGTRVTYVQMERPTFAELRAGLQMPFRVSLNPPAESDSHVVGINIRGQFFSDLWLSLSPHCNALIGVKGSGKTSLLECLRFVLGCPVPASRKEDVDSHLRSILGPAGLVRVLVRRKDGALIVIERASNNPGEFRLTFEDDRRVVVQNPEALMFPSYILGWHEIEQAATDARIRQVYLDTIAGRERIRQLREAADAAANRVQQLHGQVTARYAAFRSLSEQVARLADLRSGLRELTEANLVELRNAYEVAVRQKDAHDDLKRSLREAAGNLDSQFDTSLASIEVNAFSGDSPLEVFAIAATEMLTRLKQDFIGIADQRKAQLLAVADELEHQTAELEEAFAQFTKNYAASVANLPPQMQRLLETHRQVMDDTRALPRLQAEMETERALIENLLAQLSNACNEVSDALDEQTRLRTEKVAALNSQLAPLNVRLDVAPLALRSAFDELSGRFAQGAAIVNQLNTLASDERRYHRRLARAYDDLRRDLLNGFSLFFSTAEFSNYLHAFEEDDLKIGFAVGKAGEPYSPIDQLSAGQRCTAVFPLLLKLQEGPLIVDQPEDNLDNRHIADSIAPALRQDKAIRQIAFTSHNANLVVLTDAEHIAMFEASGSLGQITTRGFLCTSASSITPHVIAILDGGPQALQLRYRKYGIVSQLRSGA